LQSYFLQVRLLLDFLPQKNGFNLVIVDPKNKDREAKRMELERDQLFRKVGLTSDREGIVLS
jgi:hypothetical protein